MTTSLDDALDPTDWMTKIHDNLWGHIEKSMTPDEKGHWSLLNIPVTVILIPVGIVASMCQIASHLCQYVPKYFTTLPDPNEDFNSIRKDSRLWSKIDQIQEEGKTSQEKDAIEWKKIDAVIGKTKLGHNNPNFSWSVASCTFQDSPQSIEHSQWRPFIKEKLPENNRWTPDSLLEQYKTPEGRKAVIAKLQELKVNSFRTSLPWAAIQPTEKEWNGEIIQRFVELAKDLKKEGIELKLTMHHFSEPAWFFNKGSFRKEENLQHFRNFVERAIAPFIENEEPLVSSIYTINEPGVEGLSRFVRGAFPPGKSMEFTKAAKHIAGCLKAHNIAYGIIKKINQNVKVGFTHQYLNLHHANVVLQPVTTIINRIANQCILNWLKTGTFRFTMPGVHVHEEIGQLKADFMGLQFYSEALIGLLGSTSYCEKMTQMPFRENPEGLYKAIIDLFQSCNANRGPDAPSMPIEITENGISTADDTQRGRYIARALYAAYRAAQIIGEENLTGFTLWSFMRNLEWDMGVEPQDFGAFKDLNSPLKKGSTVYPKAVDAWRASLQEDVKIAG